LPAGRSEETDSNPIEKLAASDFDEYMEQLKLKSENPYHMINLSNANNIRINSIRDLVSKIYLSVPAGHTKVFLITQAEKMKQEAANALLKVLEEPPQKSLLILTTSKINALPSTIAGRCQKINFELLKPEQILRKLTETSTFPKKDIELASRISYGSYNRALQFLNTGINELRNDALEFLVSILKNQYADTVLIARSITARNDRDKTRNFLNFLNIWFRDLMHVKYFRGDSESTPANADIMERLGKLQSNYPDTDIFSIIMELEEADRLITQNVQLTLILVNLAFRLKELIK
jgi:DNA polymerase-3 subunit delta'